MFAFGFEFPFNNLWNFVVLKHNWNRFLFGSHIFSADSKKMWLKKMRKLASAADSVHNKATIILL